MKNFDVSVIIQENNIYIISVDEDFDDFIIDIDKYWDFVKKEGLDLYYHGVYKPKDLEKYVTGESYYFYFSDYCTKPQPDFKDDLEIYFKENKILF